MSIRRAGVASVPGTKGLVGVHPGPQVPRLMSARPDPGRGKSIGSGIRPKPINESLVAYAASAESLVASDAAIRALVRAGTAPDRAHAGDERRRRAFILFPPRYEERGRRILAAMDGIASARSATSKAVALFCFADGACSAPATWWPVAARARGPSFIDSPCL